MIRKHMGPQGPICTGPYGPRYRLTTLAPQKATVDGINQTTLEPTWAYIYGPIWSQVSLNEYREQYQVQCIQKKE